MFVCGIHVLNLLFAYKFRTKRFHVEFVHNLLFCICICILSQDNFMDNPNFLSKFKSKLLIVILGDYGSWLREKIKIYSNYITYS